MFQKIKRAMALKKALGQVQEIEEQAEMSTFSTLVKSKRFWISMAGLAATVGGILPAKYAAYALIAANLLTKVIDMGIVTGE